jgi:heme-degrading monooxygenase HmoA
MYARSTTVRGDPGAMDEGIAVCRNEVWPMVQGMSGCVGMSMMADRDAGRCIVTTAWASDEAMRASAEMVKDSRARAAEALRADTVDVDEWQIAVLHRVRPAGDDACVRATWTDIMPGEVDHMVDSFRMVLMPRLQDMPGFCSLNFMVDRMRNRGVGTVTFEDRAALERSREMTMRMREEVVQGMPATITETAEFELVMAHLHVPEMA